MEFEIGGVYQNNHYGIHRFVIDIHANKVYYLLGRKDMTYYYKVRRCGIEVFKIRINR